MRLSAISVAVAALLLAGASAPGRAAEADGVPSALAGALVPSTELGRDRARGVLLNEAVSNGRIVDNRVGPNSLTGIITNSNSVNNNTGLTTVFQNTGNNSLFQSSTSIYINIR